MGTDGGDAPPFQAGQSPFLAPPPPLDASAAAEAGLASLHQELIDPGGLASEGDICGGIELEGHPLQFDADAHPMDVDDCGPEFEPPDTPESMHSMVIGAARGEAASSSGAPMIRFVVRNLQLNSYAFFVHTSYHLTFLNVYISCRNANAAELVRLVSHNPNEFSFFDEAAFSSQMRGMRLWAGPNHWRPNRFNQLLPHAVAGLPVDADNKPLVSNFSTLYN